MTTAQMTVGRKKRAPEPTMADIRREVRLQGLILSGLLAVMWILELLDIPLMGQLDALGIRPREPAGLVGVLLAPFLHGGLGHLAANTLPFLVLGWFVMLRETWHFLAVTLAAMFVGGLGTWLVGRTGSVHIGASGLIFGYFGYLLLGGYFERRIATILGSIVVALLYGGLIFGVLPNNPGISWEGHLFGFLGGVLMAWALAKRAPKKPAQPG